MSDHATTVAASRGVLGTGYTVLTPANRYASRLPNLRDGLLYKLVTPRLAPARFGQYVVGFAAGGTLRSRSRPASRTSSTSSTASRRCAPTASTRRCGPAAGSTCRPRPPSACARASVPPRCCGSSAATSRGPGLAAPEALAGHRDDVPFEPDPAVPGFRRRELLDPLDPRYDFNMSLLRLRRRHRAAQGRGPRRGARPLHDGPRGLYHLAGVQHEVREHDFIYMAPYCPQSFVATGDVPAEYLLYKDVYRDGF